MSDLYHLVPSNMFGSVLMPLNMLREKSPEAYQSRVAKYAWRKEVMRQRIPPLDCLWNDVLFFTAVEPERIAKAYKSCGMKLRRRRFFRIDPALIEPSRASVWLFESESKEARDFVPYDPLGLERFASMPEATLAYYRMMARMGRRNEVLVFAYIPHILFKGTIDITNTEIVEV